MSTEVTTGTELSLEMQARRAETRTLVVIPAFNEVGRLSDVLFGIQRQGIRVDVLVVDDGSTDRTWKEAQAAGAFVARHPFNLGYGAALETGYRFALERHYDYVSQMDGDGQHEPECLSAVLEPVLHGEADVVVGSRFIEKGDYRSSLERRLGSWWFGALATLIIGQRVTDPTSGYWAMNRKGLRLCTSGFFPHDYPDADVLIGMHLAGLSIREVPVRMYPSEGGKSMHRGIRPFYYVFKMSLAIFAELLRKRPSLPEDG